MRIGHTHTHGLFSDNDVIQYIYIPKYILEIIIIFNSFMIHIHHQWRQTNTKSTMIDRYLYTYIGTYTVMSSDSFAYVGYAILYQMYVTFDKWLHNSRQCKI